MAAEETPSRRPQPEELTDAPHTQIRNVPAERHHLSLQRLPVGRTLRPIDRPAEPAPRRSSMRRGFEVGPRVMRRHTLSGRRGDVKGADRDG
jgi:hypothetical protein